MLKQLKTKMHVLNGLVFALWHCHYPEGQQKIIEHHSASLCSTVQWFCYYSRSLKEDFRVSSEPSIKIDNHLHHRHRLLPRKYIVYLGVCSREKALFSK